MNPWATLLARAMTRKAQKYSRVLIVIGNDKLLYVNKLVRCCCIVYISVSNMIISAGFFSNNEQYVKYTFFVMAVITYVSIPLVFTVTRPTSNMFDMLL